MAVDTEKELRERFLSQAGRPNILNEGRSPLDEAAELEKTREALRTPQPENAPPPTRQTAQPDAEAPLSPKAQELAREIADASRRSGDKPTPDAAAAIEGLMDRLADEVNSPSAATEQLRTDVAPLSPEAQEAARNIARYHHNATVETYNDADRKNDASAKYMMQLSPHGLVEAAEERFKTEFDIYSHTGDSPLHDFLKSQLINHPYDAIRPGYGKFVSAVEEAIDAALAQGKKLTTLAEIEDVAFPAARAATLKEAKRLARSDAYDELNKLTIAVGESPAAPALKADVQQNINEKDDLFIHNPEGLKRYRADHPGEASEPQKGNNGRDVFIHNQADLDASRHRTMGTHNTNTTVHNTGWGVNGTHIHNTSLNHRDTHPSTSSGTQTLDTTTSTVRDMAVTPVSFDQLNKDPFAGGKGELIKYLNSNVLMPDKQSGQPGGSIAFMEHLPGHLRIEYRDDKGNVPPIYNRIGPDKWENIRDMNKGGAATIYSTADVAEAMVTAKNDANRNAEFYVTGRVDTTMIGPRTSTMTKTATSYGDKPRIKTTEANRVVFNQQGEGRSEAGPKNRIAAPSTTGTLTVHQASPTSASEFMKDFMDKKVGVTP